ncbi:MAG: NAD(P)-dependent oxidoreductase [Bryobacterales bacterium]|nr:NAD(P)-dependent oxidoreductase [Bryobacterales bacterium]
MRILITGASGFIGRRLLKRLETEGGGHDMFVLPSPHFQPARVAGRRYRLVESAAEARAELIYHLAGPALEASEAEHEAVTVGGTRRLLAALGPAAPGRRPPRLVLAGSGAEYGSGHGWRETDAPRPDTALGRAKCAAAAYARAAALTVSLVHLRLFTPFGAGEAETRLIPSAVRAAVRGEAIRLRTTGEQTRDYVEIDDVVEALVRAGRPDAALAPGITINVCSGQPRRALDVAACVARIAGSGVRVEPGTVRPEALRESAGDGGRARELLGWEPRRDFEAALADLVAAARQPAAA